MQRKDHDNTSQLYSDLVKCRRRCHSYTVHQHAKSGALVVVGSVRIKHHADDLAVQHDAIDRPPSVWVREWVGGVNGLVSGQVGE